MELDNAAHLAPINVTEADKSPLTNDDLSLPPTPQTTTEAFQTTYVVAADQETAVVLEGQITSVIESHKEVDVISASITRSAILDYLENSDLDDDSDDDVEYRFRGRTEFRIIGKDKKGKGKDDKSKGKGEDKSPEKGKKDDKKVKEEESKKKK